MKKFNYKREIIFWVIIIIPAIYLAYVWNALPERVPIHFDAKGEPNGWGSRASEFILIGINVLTYLFLLFFKKIDPKNPGESYFTSNFYKFRIALIFFLSAISVMVIHAGLPGNGLFNGQWMMALLFLFFAVLGNFMINLKPSWFIGIRTPWTLSNDVVWRKTHQLGGRVWFYGGLLCAALTFLLSGALLEALLLTFVLGSAVFFFVYSFWLFKQEQKHPGQQ
jgi:immunity protein, SdpI family